MPQNNSEAGAGALRHIGIIMDGNGRWAKKRGLPRSFGHRAGAKTFRAISEDCRLMGIEFLTLYAFSTENWSRSKEEIDTIMGLLKDYLDEVFADKDYYLKKNMRVRFLGDKSALSGGLAERMAELEETTLRMTGMTLNLAVNYGGRDEILRAARILAGRARSGELAPEDITKELFSSCLYTAGQPDPDLIIRTAGEMRTSNFLTWQSVYAEYMATETLWPDFSRAELVEMIKKFNSRERRFGGAN
ncbi:MAG: di-trans,poly-cis-decaprenylcistransferase [Oscillospiraceae bacterium]|jgi:undecaprenyl diphosphate synthase|nr:di-trans,poly-cis-decaprenylcistransferase [Oscillospiraceae bacterium]